MSKPFSAPEILFNSIEDQKLTYANQLNIKQWNNIINILKTQANDLSKYLKAFDDWMFDETDGYYNKIPMVTSDDTVEEITTIFDDQSDIQIISMASDSTINIICNIFTTEETE